MNKYNIQIATSLTQYFNLPRFIWINSDHNIIIRARFESRRNFSYIKFGIRIEKYEKK